MEGRAVKALEDHYFRRAGTRYVRKLDEVDCAAVFAVVERACNPLHAFKATEPVALRVVADSTAETEPYFDDPDADLVRLVFDNVEELVEHLDHLCGGGR
jgi:hypothetical protein